MFLCVLGEGVDYKELAHAIMEADKSRNLEKWHLSLSAKARSGCRTRMSQRPSWKAELSLIGEGPLLQFYWAFGLLI